LINAVTTGGRLAVITGSGTLQSSIRWGNGSNFAGNIVDNGATRIGINTNGFSGGTVTLSGNNSGGTGDFLVANNILRLDSANAISAAAYLRLEAGTGTAIAELRAADLTRTATAATNGGGIVLVGTGTAGFAAVNADRTVTLQGGSVNTVTLGTAPYSATTLALGTTASTHKVTLVNPVALGGAVRAITAGNGSAAVEGEFSGVLSGTGSSGLLKSGAGTIQLSGDNTFAGAVQFTTAADTNTGWLRLNHSNALGLDATAKTINLSSSTGAAVGGIELTGGITVNNKNLQLGGRTTDATDRSSLRNVTGNNAWNGSITITNSGGGYFATSLAGRLEIGGSVSNEVAASTRGLTLRGAGDYLFSGSIKNGSPSGAVTSLTMSGTGTASLTGAAHTYTGATQINSGTMLVNGSLGSSDFTVAAAGTLGGTGSIGGNLTVSGALRPGSSPGSLEIAGATTTLNSTATTYIELGGTAFTLNGTEEYDRIKLSNAAATLGLGGSTLDVTLVNSFILSDNQAFGIMQVEGSTLVSGMFGSFADNSIFTNLSGKDLYITYTGSFGDSGLVSVSGGNDVVLYTIPEPATAILGGLGLLALLRRRRN
jgi:autotransporter-associated beta strand protein